MNYKKIKSWFGHRVRELFVYLTWLLQPGHDNSVAIFPWCDQSQGSSNLRAYEIGKSLKKLGWRVCVVPKQLELSQRLRLLKFLKPKVILIQKQRHILNRPSLYPDFPIVFDIDDADYLDPREVDAVIDCCKGSKAVIAGSSQVAKWCSQHNPNVHIVWTGTPVLQSYPPNSQNLVDRGPIVAWGCSMSLQYPTEANFIKDVLTELAERRKFEFWLYGVDSEANAEKIFGSLREKGISLRFFSYMPYDKFLSSLETVAVGLHPLLPEQNPYSQGKSFGKVLAYIVSNVAIVVSDAVDHREFFEHGKNGMLVNSVDEWADSIAKLLDDKSLRDTIIQNAYQDFLSKLSTDVSAQKVSAVLTKVIAMDNKP